MADWTMKANDLLPPITATLSTNGAPADLTTAVGVSFIMAKEGTAQPKVNAPATIVDAVNGVVQYDWVLGDTDTPDTYEAEWEVVWADAKPQTFPTETYHSIEIRADLDGGGA